jgi:hypothetical protein
LFTNDQIKGNETGETFSTHGRNEIIQKPEIRRGEPLGDLFVDGRVILKCIGKEQGVAGGLESYCSGWSPITGYSKRGNESIFHRKWGISFLAEWLIIFQEFCFVEPVIMCSFRDVHEMNAYKADHIRLSLCPND